MKKIPDRWLYLPALILWIYLALRLIDHSKLLFHFPLDYTNDISSYMAQLFFLDKCGFHQFCPYWYNGFTAFQFTPPAWFFFTLPLYWIFNDVKIATYVSTVLIFLIGLISFILFGRLFNFSLIKRLAYFVFFLGNAIAIGNFIRLGDVHQLFGWVNFAIFAFIILYYKDKKIKTGFYWSILFLSIVVLSHQTIAILAPFILIGLFLVKRKKERLKIIAVSLLSLLITSFWWIPYITGFWGISGSKHILTKSLLSLDIRDLPQNIAAIIIPLAFLITFYYYWNTRDRNKNELLFFTPIIFLVLILLFRVAYYIPILKYVYPDSYLYLFIFFTVFMFFQLDVELIKLKRLIPSALIILSIISVSIGIFYTPNFMLPNDTGDRTIKILENVDDKFIIFGKGTEVYNKAVYSYAPIYLNLSTPEGWYFIFDEDQLELSRKTRSDLEHENCTGLKNDLNLLGAKYAIAYDEQCEKFKKCGFIEKENLGNVCLYHAG